MIVSAKMMTVVEGDSKVSAVRVQGRGSFLSSICPHAWDGAAGCGLG